MTWSQTILLGLFFLAVSGGMIYVRGRPGWSIDGPPGCPALVGIALGVIVGSMLVLAGMVGAFMPRLLVSVERGLSLLITAVEAWEIVLQVLFFLLFVGIGVMMFYRSVIRRRPEESGNGCFSIGWLLFLAGYVYLLYKRGEFTSILAPFRDLFDIFW